MERDRLIELVRDLSSQVERLEGQIAELTKADRKNRREIIHLQKAVENERAIADAKANHELARSLAQRERDKYFKLLMASSPNTILFLDINGRIAYCTDVFLRRARFSDLSEVRGRTFEEVFCRFADRKWIDTISWFLLESVGSNAMRMHETSLDIERAGEPRKYIIHLTPMTSEDGEHEGMLLLFGDVTDIERAREEAERANEAKSTFLSNMSNEMRAPIDAIIGMTSIGRSSPDVERKDRALAKIADASAHLLGVIDDILDISRIEANRFELSSNTFSFEKMLRDAADAIRPRADEKRLGFTVHIDPAIPGNLVGDDKRLAQVTANLLSNAVKFTPERGSIRLDVRSVGEENGVYTIRIEVTDTGIGISPERQRRIFDSFQRAEGNSSRKFGGTGLGLAISKRIVEMMGGGIWVKSAPGRGSTFAFTVRAERG
ncbi:MAG: PAS domain S-box protein [Synergistaceae bacterium]|jgi:PAS domain S-box-containing protein|nr:PAS domain S-box protein [Synergistaceae bacterium]